MIGFLLEAFKEWTIYQGLLTFKNNRINTYILHVKYDPKYNDKMKNKMHATSKLTDLKMHI